MEDNRVGSREICNGQRIRGSRRGSVFLNPYSLTNAKEAVVPQASPTRSVTGAILGVPQIVVLQGQCLGKARLRREVFTGLLSSI